MTSFTLTGLSFAQSKLPAKVIQTMQKLTITRPDDWHLHLRDDKALATTVPDAAKRFARAIVMPNLNPPITHTNEAIAYRARIKSAIPSGLSFEPLMTLYLTDHTNKNILCEAKNSGFIKGCKLYPAGATTHSHAGVTEIKKIYPALEIMQEQNLVLMIHGEVTTHEIDIFDREKHFIDQSLTQLVKDFPQLRIVLEHITTQDAVEFVKAGSANLAATITAHHLLLNRNHLLAGGIRPHFYCLPVVKRRHHQQALIAAAISGNSKFFLGTDSAPHAQYKKENACGCAGIYTAHAAIELYAEVFEQASALPKLEAFASWHGADFYQLPRNTSTITLEKKPWQVPESVVFDDAQLVPFRAGEFIRWQIV